MYALYYCKALSHSVIYKLYIIMFLLFLFLEATDDAFHSATQISISVQSSGTNPPSAITSEVKKLGLTADVQNNLSNFEPRWVEVQPKYNCYGSRRHSIGKKKTGVEKEVLAAPVKGSADNVIQSKDDLDLVKQTTLQRMAEFLDDTGVDFSQIVDVPETSGTDSVLQMTRSPLIKRGGLFRRDDPQTSEDMITFVRGGIFGSKKGLRRSSSTSKLQAMKEEENRKMEPYHGSNSSSSDVFESSKELNLDRPKNLGHRRSSSMGSLQRLNTTENDEDKTSDVHGEKISEKYNSKQSGDGTTPLKSVKDHITSVGKQTVSWATTSKVRQSKREKQFFAPTSF